MNLIADRFKKLKISPTMKIAAEAMMLIASGEDIVDLTVGEPDFPTPDNAKNAGIEAINNNFTKYTLNAGLVELRKAIVQKFKTDNNLDYDIKEILVSNGAKQALFNAVLAVVDDGDEVIIPAPYYATYAEIVKISNGTPVEVHAKEENDFKLTPEELENAITAKTRAFILCNPCNPTGTVYTENELKALLGVLEGKDIIIISDEVYEKLVYDGIKFVSAASISEKIKEQTVIVNGVSKAYAMTGWRIGFAAGPKPIIDAANIIQSHCTSGASSISQYASLEALTGDQESIKERLAEYQMRRDFLYSELLKIPSVTCVKPEGAFYVFPNLSSFFGKSFNGTTYNNSYELGYYLLREGKVAIVPGSGFYSDNNIRISYSTSLDNIKKGVERMSAALGKLE